MHRVPICDFFLFLESQVAYLAGAVQSLLERAIKWTLTTIHRPQYRKTFSSSFFLNILTKNKPKIGLTLGSVGRVTQPREIQSCNRRRVFVFRHVFVVKCIFLVRAFCFSFFAWTGYFAPAIIIGIFHTNEQFFSRMLIGQLGVISQVLFSSEQPKKNKMAFI